MDTEKIANKLKEMKAKRVMIQVPEGLKTRLVGIVDEIQKHGFDVLVSCEPCFGACDLNDAEAKELDCDVILHIGHTDFGVKSKIPVIYEPYPLDANAVSKIKKHEKEITKYKNICLVTTSQFLSVIEPSKKYLESIGLNIHLHKQTRSGEIGQVLGCDYSAALPLEKEVDVYIYLGSGIFHPLGLALRTEKPVISIDMETGHMEYMTNRKNKHLRIKAYNIGVAQDADKFGILLTTKPGQMILKQAESIKKKLQSKGKDVYILIMNQITPDKILGVDVEVIVNCACPRMDEDYELFKKPILNPEDVDKI